MDHNTPRHQMHCPVAECPWVYDRATPRAAGDEGDGRIRMVIPAPSGEHLRPVEIAAGVAAAQPKMAVQAGSFNDLVAVVAAAARDQDNAVIAAHLAGHSYAQLADALEDSMLDFTLNTLVAAGYTPPAVTVPWPGGTRRIVACWMDDPAGYQCSVCRTVYTSGPVAARHFLEQHVHVSSGIRGLPATPPAGPTTRCGG